MKGACTGQRSKIKVVTLTVLVASLYAQNCVCAHFTSSVCQCRQQDRISPEPKTAQKQGGVLQQEYEH